MNESYWIASTPATDYPGAPDTLTVDVAVLGGGIAGLNVAAALKARGRTVAVVEAARILEGVTGNTTAKVTASHGLIYAYLVDKLGEDRARLYATAQQTAVEHIATTADRDGIQCDLVRTESYVYSEDETEPLQAEAAAAQRLGLPAHYTTETPLPWDVQGAVRYDDQLRFHPRKYLLALAERIDGDGSVILEHTRALDVDEGDPCTVTTDRGVIRASHVVVATHIPFLDRGLYFARQFPMRDYVVAGRLPKSSDLDGMYLSTEQPTHSVRVTEDGDGRLVIVGGEGHTTGRADDTAERYERLEAWARERLGVTAFTHRWSTQDYTSSDRVPFIGRFRADSRRLWVATAFGAWGMTNGTVAGLLLADLVTGQENPWTEVFDPARLAPSQKLLKENAAVAKHLVGGYVSPGDVSNVADVKPGEAAVVRSGLGKVAAYRDDDGVLHAVSARCTHMGCVVAWNGAERSWDCPCHGSRFDVDGHVLQGPAVRDLGAADVQAER